MTTEQAHGMLLFHQRAAQAYRQIAAEPKTSKKDRQRCLENERQALAMAAELRKEV